MSAFAAALAAVRAGDKSADEAADELFEQLTERERRWLLDGDTPVWPGLLSMVKQYNVEPIVAGAVERLGIPGIRFTDGPRGVVMGASTCFPVPIARAATFDVTLEEEVGRAIGAEARAQGANFFGGVCVNLTRHPAWGRAQESYGEDPVLLGAMGAALTRGVRENVMACVKHFALNSMEDARFYVDVEVDDDVLHDVYLPHFRRVIEAGADAVMSAYNRVNGTWCGEHRGLLTEVLRERWGFEGVVISDFVWGLRDPVRSLAAGLDVEMPFRQQRARAKLPAEDIARSARRTLATQLKHAAQIGPTPTVEIAGPEHRALARGAAARGCVLLENDGLLPLTAESIAVVGPLAQTANTGDIGSSRVRPPSTASVLDGLKAALPDARVRLTDAAGAANHDVAVVVVGYTAKEEGEAFIETDPDMIGHLGFPIRTALGRRVVSRVVRTVGRWLHPGGGDRRSLRLPAEQEALIERVTKANPNTVVVVITGGAVVMPWRKTPRALVVAWYPGMEGGHAIADVLLGRSSPGRLPVAFPEREEDLGPFERTARRVRYDRWWGQRRLDRDGCAAAYPFGYGLGFTTFLIHAAERDGAEVHVTVVNTGARRGTTVVQLYTTPIRALVDFAVVELDPAEARTVTFATREHALEAALHHGDPAAVAVQL